jgi:hypothetical protein
MRRLDIVDDTVLRADARLARRPFYVRRQPLVDAPPSANELRAALCASSTVHPDVARISKGLQSEKRSLAQFLRFAGVTYATWWSLSRGKHAPASRTLKRLNAAWEGRPLATTETKPPVVIAAFHRIVMVMLCNDLGLDRNAVLATDFSKQRPQNQQWRQASEIRMFAVYITAVELCVENVDVAAALGISRQAVKKARDRVEDLRERPAIDELIERVAALAAGR